MIEKINIAIDGPAASGKSTVAEKLAKKLNYNFLDTGLMYRFFTLYCIKNNINFNYLEEIKIKKLLNNFNIKIKANNIYLNKKKISKKNLFSRNIIQNINKITSLNYVRAKMVEIQRNITAKKGYVVVGRDIGTVVLPKAELKFFLTANINERARRRFKEMHKKEIGLTFDKILKDLINRDEKDLNRKISPLKMSKDSILIDNTKLTFKQTLNKIIIIIFKKVKNNE